MKFMLVLAAGIAAASAQTCLHTERAVDAEIVAPMVLAIDAESHESYVWLQGNELNGGKHFNAKCPTCEGGVTFQFNIKKAGEYTFQADLIAPNNRDDSFYVATSVDHGTPHTWDVGKSMGLSTVWTWGNIEGIKDKYFPAGTHSITLKPREDGTKVRAIRVTDGTKIGSSKNVCFKQAQAPKPKCSTELATDAEIVAPMVARDGYVWLQGNELNGGKHFNAKCPTCEGGVKFQFNIKNAGKYTFQADLIAPNNRDDSFYVATSVDNDTPYTWDVGKSMGLSTVWTWGNIEGIKDKYFPAGTHSITLKPREDGTKVRAIRVTEGSKNVCFKTAADAQEEIVDVEMVIDETMESFTEDKKESLRDEIASELGLSADKVEITVGTRPNPRSSRRLITGGLLITVTIKIDSSTLTEQVDTLASPIFAKKVAAATGIQTAFKAFKPQAGSKICATCKWDGTKVHVVHYTNAQKNGEKGLQHRCYHTRGGKCKCECMSK